MKLPAILRTLALAGTMAAATSHAEERTFFAFDDVSIPWRDNVKLTMVEARKHPENPVLRRGPAGAPDHGHALMYGSVLHIDGKFRMWYLGMIEKTIERGQVPGWWRPMCYAESDDGVHWTKPELGLEELKGSKKNNICLIEGEPHSLTRVNDFLTVIHDLADPDPARRYKCAYIAHPPFADVRGGRSTIGPNESRWCSFVAATSADGLKWKIVGDRPMNAGGERFEVAGLYRFGDFYYASGQLISPWIHTPDGRDIGRAMRIYRSPDFTTWNRTTTLGFARAGQFLPEPLKGQQTHMGAGKWNRGNVMIGLYGMWQDPAQPPPKGAKSHLLGTRIDLGFIVSNDGIHWREPVPDFKTIPRGKEGEWDTIALLQAHAFANVGDKTYMWYSHWDCDAEFRNQDIGLATLRRDGFGFLTNQKEDAPAVCETTFFDAKAGTKVYANVDGVTEDAPLEVELLDERAQPIAGFTQDASAAVTKSGTRVAINWRTPLPAGKKVALRLVFPEGGKTKLFALYLAED
jgi:hypothetical protein